jgi:hypothetical protein
MNWRMMYFKLWHLLKHKTCPLVKIKEILLNNLDTIYSRTRNISKENSIVETGTYFLSNLKK